MSSGDPTRTASSGASVKRDDRRVRARAFGGLHAHPLDEAVAVEEHTFPVPLGDAGVLVSVPQPFTYLLMKLLAFREHFAAPDSLGILRLREHQLFFGRMDLNRFREELSAILPPLAT